MRILQRIPTCLLAASVLFCAPLVIGIWLPDVISRTPKVLVTETNSAGHVFSVEQHWNDDFYATVLKHRKPGGERQSVLIDPDAGKLWRGSVFIRQDGLELAIGRRIENLARYDWSRMELTRPNGVKVLADPE